VHGTVIGRRGRVVALSAGLFAIAGLLAACGGHPAHSASSASSTTTAPAVGSTTTSPVTTAPSSTTTTVPSPSTSSATLPPGPPPGGPVPSGFDPVSFTAISDSEYWLLGEAPCSNPVCTSIVRTTDGGAHFVGIPAPPAPLDTGSGNGPSDEVNTVRFADALDGYVYDSNGGSAFWATHDGGEHWSQPPLLSGQDLLAFGTGGGYAFALVGACASGACSNLSLRRSIVGSDAWSPLSVALPAGATPGAGLAVHGSNVWLSVSTSAPKQLLLASTSSGSSFATGTSPCLSQLGGALQAAGADVLWAVCPTGTLAGLWRSTDAGAQWQSLSTGSPLPNSALVAPASASDAVLAPVGEGQLSITTDGGTTWQPVPNTVTTGFWVWAGFTDSSTGSALSSASSAPPEWPWPNGPLPEQLWRTSNGGASWSGPVNIG